MNNQQMNNLPQGFPAGYQPQTYQTVPPSQQLAPHSVNNQMSQGFNQHQNMPNGYMQQQQQQMQQQQMHQSFPNGSQSFKSQAYSSRTIISQGHPQNSMQPPQNSGPNPNQLMAQIQQLQDQNSKLQDQNQQLVKKMNDALHQNHSNAQNQINQQGQQNQALAAQNQQMFANMESMKQQLSSSHSSISGIQEENQRLHNQCSSLHQQCDSLNHQLSMANQEIARLKSETNSLMQIASSIQQMLSAPNPYPTNELSEALVFLIRAASDYQDTLPPPAPEFYQSHSEWVNGFVSAAQHIATTTSYLMTAIDSNVSEQVTVASREICRSVQSFVTAMRVKGTDPRVEQASARVVRATEAISGTVPTLQSGKSGVEIKSGVGGRIQEMDQMVAVMKLEKELSEARDVLGKLRKNRYE